MTKLARREILKSLSIAAAASAAGCAAPDDELGVSEAAQTRGLPDSAFDPEVILPFYDDDPKRLPRGKSRRVLVIGGGLAGLSSALELAERGYDVAVREAAPVLGGRLSTRKERLRTGEFNVEHGLHMWFHQYYNSFDVFRRLGVSDKFASFDQVYFKFRNYEAETLESKGPYPLNLIGILKRSPNLSLKNAINTFGAVGDIIFYNHFTNWSRFDDETYERWGRRTKVDRAFWDIIMGPAASVTLNDTKRISAAEMLQLMHIYFIGHPRAFNRYVTVEDHGTSIIDPWAARVRQLGGTVSTSAPVRGLRFAGDRVVGEVGSTETFDHVVLATDIPGLKRVLAGSTAMDARGAALLARFRSATARLAIAPAYSVLRVWLDKPTAPRPFSQAVIETSEYRPINLVALFHMLEKESLDWARRANGSVLEYHLYTTPELSGLDAGQIWNKIRPVAVEIMPDIAGARPLDFSLGSYENFTSFEIGQGRDRPRSNSPKLDWGIQNLALAGDWVHTLYPSALMERAVCTGREAANHILRSDRVREAELRVAKVRGPGIIPQF
jgi:carotenoid phi-ring synthase / carotenoid chi-ring synthase